MAWLFLLLIVAPLVELYVIIEVAQVIGGWETIALLIVESIIGAWLLKRQGLSTLNRVSAALAENRVPGKELADGFLIMIAGALMLAPGFLGDIIAFALLLPPTRAPVRALLMRRISKGGFMTSFTTSAAGSTRFVGTFRADPVVDTTGMARADEPVRGELES